MRQIVLVRTFDIETKLLSKMSYSYAKKSKLTQEKTDISTKCFYEKDADLVASSFVSEVGTKDNDLLCNMFYIDNNLFQVTLCLIQQKMFFEPINKIGGRKNLNDFSGFLMKKKLSTKFNNVHNINIDLCNVFASKLIHSSSNKHNDDSVFGLSIYFVENKESNLLINQEVCLKNSSNEICNKWQEKIVHFIDDLQFRPRNIKLFVQPYAGEKRSYYIYKNKIAPLFQTANIAIDMTVVVHNEHIKHEMVHMNLDDFDCVVAMGGDGTVNNVLNGLMSQSQKKCNVDVKPGFSPVKAQIPLGIIPTGKTNHIAFTVSGTDDFVTAALHIILGTWTPVNIICICTSDLFFSWAFNCHYGFAGNVLRFMKRYSKLGKKCINASFFKSLTSSKLRSYSGEIEYIPSATDAGVSKHDDNSVCFTGCIQCEEEQPGVIGDTHVITDMVEEVDLNNSTCSVKSADSFIELKQDSPWHTVKGKFMNVSIFGIAANCSLAPRGLSKYSHRHDGNIDLVITKDVSRMQFIRFLRRHGNSKNQFDFPFVDVIRCKEVHFRPRSSSSWSYKDHDFSEINYQLKQWEKVDQLLHRPMEIIDDLEEVTPTSQSYGENRQSTCKFDSSDDEEEGNKDTVSADTSKNEGNQRLQSTIRNNMHGDVDRRHHQYIGPQYRPTWTEQELTRRKQVERKKEEKKKEREERKSRSVWNIDNEICTTLDLDFRIHCGLLKVNGKGMSPNTVFNDVRFTCLP